MWQQYCTVVSIMYISIMSYTDGNGHGLHIQHHKPQHRLRIDRMTRAHTRTHTHMHARTQTHTQRWNAQGSDLWKMSVIPAAVCFRWTETMKTARRQSLHVGLLSSRQNPMGSPKTWLPWNYTHVPAVSQCIHSSSITFTSCACFLFVFVLPAFWL